MTCIQHINTYAQMNVFDGMGGWKAKIEYESDRKARMYVALGVQSDPRPTLGHLRAGSHRYPRALAWSLLNISWPLRPYCEHHTIIFIPLEF